MSQSYEGQHPLRDTTTSASRRGTSILRTFHIMLSPGNLVQVSAPFLTTALAAARDAFPYLRLRNTDRQEACPVGDDDVSYHLSCLLCGATNPEREGKSPLVALQEHHMDVHGFTQQEFRASIRVFQGTDDEGCYVWALPPNDAQRLQLPALSYSRAARFRISTPLVSPQRDSVYTALVFTKTIDSSKTTHEVDLVDQDVDAWYGYFRGDAHVGEPTVWPKQEWKRE